MRILIAPDKFKGSLSATEAAVAIQAGFQVALPEAAFEIVPIADGGEGTVEAMTAAMNGEILERSVTGPRGAPVRARLGWVEEEKVAIVEMAEAAGFKLLKEAERDPLRTTTRGVGELMKAAQLMGAERVIVGLGGSATNDGGAGMAAALGFRFLDESGSELDPIPVNLHRVARIEPSVPWRAAAVLAASDVRNPLLGSDGASRVFSPQKGADEAAVERLEVALSNLARIAERDLGCDFSGTAGAGAAGGLGFGLLTFCGAEIRSGFEVVAETLHLEKAVLRADLVVTGEGSLDAQTLGGKGPAALAAMAKRHGKRVIAFAGKVAEDAGLESYFDARYAIAGEDMELAEAMRNASRLLRDRAEQVARKF